jgi:hypothetical protein
MLLVDERGNRKMAADEREEGAGWLLFAGVVLLIMGISRILDAIWAFRFKGSVPDHLQDSLFGQTLSSYGWVWLVMGILLILSGIGIFSRNQYARWFGIVVASLAAVSSMAWMPYYPVWALVYMGLGILVVYALGTYGKREGMI